jgi:hypothetical protein
MRAIVVYFIRSEIVQASLKHIAATATGALGMEHSP